MSVASKTALMGSRMLEIYPNLRVDFFMSDRDMLSMFFGIPKWMSPEPYKVREKAMHGIRKWQQQMQEECKGEPQDPKGEAEWELTYGSRINRARQR